jgi:hypothetical protein
VKSVAVSCAEKHYGDRRADIADPSHQHCSLLVVHQVSHERYGQSAIAHRERYGRLTIAPGLLDLGAGVWPGAPIQRCYVIGGDGCGSFLNAAIPF